MASNQSLRQNFKQLLRLDVHFLERLHGQQLRLNNKQEKIERI